VTIRPGTPAQLYYVHADHLGTPRTVTRSSDNAIVWRWDSDPFGVLPPNQNPGGLGVFTLNLRYPGQYFDGETGLSYNYFRDYDPQVGRYVESDPLLQSTGRFVSFKIKSPRILTRVPQLFASYGYAFESPALTSDRFGLGPLEWFDLGKKLFESTECIEAKKAVQEQYAKCNKECPKDASLEKQAEFIDKYTTNDDYMLALAHCVCRSIPEKCAKAGTCGFTLIY